MMDPDYSPLKKKDDGCTGNTVGGGDIKLSTIH